MEVRVAAMPALSGNQLKSIDVYQAHIGDFQMGDHWQRQEGQLDERLA